MNDKKLTPMMEQWHQAKRQHEDAILLFRMGDFYELFGMDAVVAAPILGLALTSRDKDKSGLKMAGFPFHAAENYIKKLIDHGHKIAVCEQLEDPKQSKGVVKRGITEVLTPGTAIIAEGEPQVKTSVLLGIIVEDGDIALSALDLLAGNFLVCSSAHDEKIIEEALRLSPKEIVIATEDEKANALCEKLKLIAQGGNLRIEKRQKIHALPAGFVDVAYAKSELKVLALVLSYVYDLQGQLPSHICGAKRYAIDDQLLMDETTRTNLDLLPKNKGDKHNLLSVVDDTRTTMGKRVLYHAINAPLTSKEKIDSRYEVVTEFFSHGLVRKQVRDALSGCYDIEKLTALLSSRKISPRGFYQLKESLFRAQEIRNIISLNPLPHAQKLLHDIDDFSVFCDTLHQALVDEPPITVRDGGVFRRGFNARLDELMGILNFSQDGLKDLEARERKATGINSLKIKFTRVFGYYIEITKSHLEKVPAHYRRKQTVATGERFTTDELRQLEAKMVSAESDALSIEEALFSDLLELGAAYTRKLMFMAHKLALVDMLAGFAEIACARSYVRPTIENAEAKCIDIKEGRHAIVDDICLKSGSYFVPNDIALSNDANLLLLTGPNMAGKSTVMRQVALIQIMAQIGSYVPAKSATLSICDAIFARVGASDDIRTGRSTFMVEMTETASILKNATPTSLILLDEIGRGTSTYDGLSIAQSVLEFIHNELTTRTLFATHYHELTKTEEYLPGVKNFHIEIEDGEAGIRFLYTLGKGPSLKSFGIQVAELSGLPRSVIVRAREVLASLENHAPPVAIAKSSGGAHPQLDFFNAKQDALHLEERVVLKKMAGLDLNRLTPLEAFYRLASWQSSLRKGG